VSPCANEQSKDRKERFLRKEPPEHSDGSTGFRYPSRGGIPTVSGSRGCPHCRASLVRGGWAIRPIFRASADSFALPSESVECGATNLRGGRVRRCRVVLGGPEMGPSYSRPAMVP
jgi:hypothetical protein